MTVKHQCSIKSHKVWCWWWVVVVVVVETSHQHYNKVSCVVEICNWPVKQKYVTLLDNGVDGETGKRGAAVHLP